jgi:excisionase family DNA binding protein
MQEGELLTYDQMSRYLSITPNTLRIWVMQKRIPYLKIGKNVRFYASDVHEWLSKQAIEPKDV